MLTYNTTNVCKYVLPQKRSQTSSPTTVSPRSSRSPQSPNSPKSPRSPRSPRSPPKSPTKQAHNKFLRISNMTPEEYLYKQKSKQTESSSDDSCSDDDHLTKHNKQHHKKIGAGVILISFANQCLELLCVQAATGIWSYPKGHPKDDNEKLIDCALREFEEESSIQLENFKDSHKRWIKILNQVYFVDVVSDENITKLKDIKPHDDKEIKQCRWCTLDFLLDKDLNWALQQTVKVFIEDNFVTRMLFNSEFYTEEQQQYLPQKDNSKLYKQPKRLCFFWQDAEVCCVHDDCPTTKEQYLEALANDSLESLFINQLPLHSNLKRSKNHSPCLSPSLDSINSTIVVASEVLSYDSPPGLSPSTSSSDLTSDFTGMSPVSLSSSSYTTTHEQPPILILDGIENEFNEASLPTNQDSPNQQQPNLTSSTFSQFKYSVCRHWIRQGFCNFGDNCLFYHPIRKVCKYIEANQSCIYGNKCLFLHTQHNTN